MALKDDCLWTDPTTSAIIPIESDCAGGGSQTYVVQDTSDKAIADTSSAGTYTDPVTGAVKTITIPGLGLEKTYRETRLGKTFRWLGCTLAAADAFRQLYQNASTTDFQVYVRYYCDNIILRSYTVEYSFEWTVTTLIK